MDTRIFRWIAASWLLAATALANAQMLTDPELQVTEVASGLDAPTAMAFIGPQDLLVVQKHNGWVRRVLNGMLQPDPVLDVAVDQLSERGLLGMAVHPDFPTTPFVYLYYTQSGTAADTTGDPPPVAHRIERFTWNGSALVEPVLIAALPATPGPNHDGGTITFGPDAKLYAVIGDLNHRGQLQNISDGPEPDDTGVILRLNDDGSTPSDNPFVAQGGNMAKYYAYGIRNSFGLAFDPLTGKLWMTENGPALYDEINLVEPAFNSGWMQLMGPLARNSTGIEALFQIPGSHYRDPAFSWLDTVAPTAIIFLNTQHLGARYQHQVLVGDITTGSLYHFTPNADRDGFTFANSGLAEDLVADSAEELQELILGRGFEGITDLKIGPDGRLYVLSFGLGKVFVIALAPATLQGVVTDGVTATGLAGVRVLARRLDPTPKALTSAGTDEAGLYTVSPLSPGHYRVLFWRSGYGPQLRQVDLPVGGTTSLDIQLPPR
jgi:glucose/arabinose dehydrogenase